MSQSLPLVHAQTSLEQRGRLQQQRRASPVGISRSSSSFSLVVNLPISPLQARCTVTAAAISSCKSVEEAGLPQQDHQADAPTSIKLKPIVGEQQFDRIIEEAQQLEEPLIVLWTANWCRKCIYLKPKLEKLAVDFYPRVQFYCVDVNAVPQRLVNRAGVTKMPTVQLWKDNKKQAEVIGGHKAYLVVNDVRQMIEDS